MPEKIIDACQVRAARAMMYVSIQGLAEQSGISESSIRRIESGSSVEVSDDLLMRLRGYFESIGFRFQQPDGTAEFCVCWNDIRNPRRRQRRR